MTEVIKVSGDVPPVIVANVGAQGPIGRPGSGYASEVVLSLMGFSPSNSRTVNSAILSDAFETVRAAGGGKITFDVPGSINTVSKIGSVYSHIALNFAYPGLEIDGQDVETDRGLIEIEGVELTATTLTAAGVKGSSVIQVASATNLTVGRMIYLRSSGEIWGGAGSVPGFAQLRKFEVNYVLSVDGLNVTLRHPLEDDYSISGFSVSVVPLDVVNDIQILGGGKLIGGGIKGAFDNGIGQIGIRIRNFDNVLVQDLMAEGWQNSVGRYTIGGNLTIDRGLSLGLKDAIPTIGFYNHVAHGVRNAKQLFATGTNMRRGALDTGTVFPTSDLLDIGGNYRNMNGSGIGTHAARRVTGTNCNADNVSAGVSVRSRDCNFQHNRITNIYGSTGIGFTMASGNYPNSSVGDVNAFYNYIHFRNDNTTGCGLKFQTDINRLTAKGNHFDNIPLHAAHLQSGRIGSVDISENRFTYRTRETGGQGIFLDNGAGFVASVGKINIGVNHHENPGSRILVDLDTPTAGVLDNVTIEQQISDNPASQQFAFTVVGGGTIGNNISMPSGSQLTTIVSGAVTAYGQIAMLRINTEASAATDDLDTINAPMARPGDIMVVRANSGSNTVVVKDGTGNLQTEGDCSLDNSIDAIVFQWTGSIWVEIARSNNGS